MSSPKEKAKELFDKYYPLASSYVDDRHEVAKQCAKIAVEEIMNTFSDYDSRREYWIEVKKEINELQPFKAIRENNV